LGLFITFEGIEGCGKTTQAALLKEHMERAGRVVTALREPGGTELGERVRALLLDSSPETAPGPEAELLLYEACRAELVKRAVRPALERGEVVVCDRFTDSTLAYQGWGRGIDRDVIRQANAFATGGLSADLTLLIDCPTRTGLGRARERIDSAAGSGAATEDRFELEPSSFHERVREGFLAIAAAEPGRVKVVDGSREISLIHKEICAIMEEAGLV